MARRKAEKKIHSGIKTDPAQERESPVRDFSYDCKR